MCFTCGADARQPNVIFILVDDLGYGDLGCYGQKLFETPNIDKLAEKGIRFTSHYSGSTVCAPARCSLLTGFHTGNAAVRGNAELYPEGQQPMPADTYTVAHHFKKAGYATAAFGKWGLGMVGSTSDPQQMGFETFYGYNCQRQAHCYYPAWLWRNDQREILWGNEGSFEKVYAPDRIHEETIKFIQTNKDNPFFIYYAILQPHADMVAPEEYMKKYRGKYLPENSYKEDYYRGQSEAHAAFVAMVDIMDVYVGGVMQALDEAGISEDTLILFSSDNGAHEEGGANPDYFNSNGEFKGYKRDLYDGGIRVPMIATWPGKIQPGATTDHVSAFWDFLPTVAEMIGQELDQPVDGISYLPTLLGKESQAEHDYLYWEFSVKGGRKAIRKGHWKGVRYNIHKNPEAPLELYQLEDDPGEENDLAAQFPEIVKELEALMREARKPSPIEKWNF
ncbi:MAG: arylsulfatase [Verrucomicrobiota bacterium]